MIPELSSSANTKLKCYFKSVFSLKSKRALRNNESYTKKPHFNTNSTSSTKVFGFVYAFLFDFSGNREYKVFNGMF